jgi:cysteine sulfinate desulfinase/cysteine desulfurase-like protein
MQKFHTAVEIGLKDMGFEIIANGNHRSASTTFVSIPEKGLLACFKLGEMGIHVGLGSACGSIHAGDSKIIKSLGREGSINDFMRISQFGEYDEKDAERFLVALKKVL